MKNKRAIKIILPLLMWGLICGSLGGTGSAWAETYEITSNGDAWEVPDHAQLVGGDTVTIDEGGTLKITATGTQIGDYEIPVEVTEGTLSVSGAGSLEIVHGDDAWSGSGDGKNSDGIVVSGSESKLTIDGLEKVSVSGFHTGLSVTGGGTVTIGGTEKVGTLEITSSTSSGVSVSGSGSTLTIDNLDKLTISGYDGIDVTSGGIVTIGSTDNGTYTVDTVEITGSSNGIELTNTSAGTLTINAETVNVSGGTEAIYMTGSGGNKVSITADTVTIARTEHTSSGGYGIEIGAVGSSIAEENYNSLEITGEKITISDFMYGIYNTGSSTVTINHTGTGDESSFDIIGNGSSGNGIDIAGNGSGTTSLAKNGKVNINSDGTINIKNFINAIELFYASCDEGEYSVNITGEEDTIINMADNGNGIFVYSSAYGVHIKDAYSLSISNSPTGAGIDVEGSSSTHGVDIDNIYTVTIEKCDTGIYSTGSSYGVNITVRDGGSVTINNNETGIRTSKVDGVTIKGVSGDYFPKLEISGNTAYGIYVNGGGSVDFKVNDLVAEDNAVLAYATASNSTISLTADTAKITGQTENPSEDYTLYAKNGGTINLNVSDITASRDTGYFGYIADASSSITISTQTGNIEGAFKAEGLVDEDEKTFTSDYAGILSLDLGYTEQASGKTTTNWTITNTSSLTELDVGDSSILKFASADSGYLNLYVGDFKSNSSGGSAIAMNIDGTDLNQSDHIYIDTHTGTSTVYLLGSYDLTDAVIGTILVSVVTENNKDTGFTSATGSYEGTLNWYDYTLDSVDKERDGGSKDLSNGKTVTNTAGYNTDWYIDSVSVDPDHGNTTTVDAVIEAGAVNYYAFRNTDKLLRRMGELRNNGDEAKGAWMRAEGAKTGRKGLFENKYNHYEIGYDEQVRNDVREKRFDGFSLSYARGNVKYGGVPGSGKERDEEIAFYRVSQYEHGQYLDLIGRAGRYSNHFDVYDSNSNKISGRDTTYGFSASAEYGRKIRFDGGWYIEPQTQLTFGWLADNDYRTNNGVYVKNMGIPSLIGRIGTNLGLEFGHEHKGIVYAKANWLHEFMGDYKIDMRTDESRRIAKGDHHEGWFEYGLGLAYQCSDAFYLYADIERTAGSDYYKDWVWNLGFRWAF